MAKKKETAGGDAGRISFRLLDERLVDELSRRAQALGKSRHDVARDLVTAGLAGEEQAGRTVSDEGLREEIAGLRAELQASRDASGEAVPALAEEIHNGIGGEVRELRSDLAKFTAQVSQASDQAGTDQILDELEKLAEGVNRMRSVAKLLRSLRGDFATSVNILLVHAGKLSQEDARNWVQNTLGGK